MLIKGDTFTFCLLCLVKICKTKYVAIINESYVNVT